MSMGEMVNLTEFAPLRRKRKVLTYWPSSIVEELYEQEPVGLFARLDSLVWQVDPFFDISEKDLKCLKPGGRYGKREWYVPVDLVRRPRSVSRMKAPPIVHREGFMPFGEVTFPWKRD